jgi:hypothetical protein
MKRFFLLALLVSLTIISWSQENKELMARVEAMLRVTGEKDLQKILDFTYPKVFTFATREQMTEALEASFDTEEFSSSFDSIKIQTVFPVFSLQNGQYAKITHSMLMRMKFKEPMDSAGSASFVELMELRYGKGKVSFDRSTNTLTLSILSTLVAIKDEYAKEWTFVNYDATDKLAELLFSKEVMAKLAEYK